MPALKDLLPTARKQAAIRGIFVQAHVEALRRKRGEGAVVALEKRFGAPLRFGRLEHVAIRDEVRLLEHALDLEGEHGLTGAARSAAAGRLHFSNFAQTLLGRALMGSLPHTPTTFRTLLHNAPSISRTVFLNSTFRCEDQDGSLVMSITNCDYPLEHFLGFFEQWMEFWGVEGGEVQGRDAHGGVYEYTFRF